MPTPTLPDDADLGFLRRRARDLQRAVRAGDDAARELVAHWHPDPPRGEPATFPLSAAQLVVARAHGFASWPRLARFFAVAARLRWDGAADVDVERDPVGAFCRLACLSYAEDGPARWAQARELLRAQPDLVDRSVWAAAAATDVEAVRRALTADAAVATRPGGPNRWRPLCYLAYSRLDPDVDRDTVLTTARLLLGAGADPNEGYLWRGLPTPFTLLTGLFGSGERGSDTPPHPHADALARLLLDAGADPNDGQALYNRMFGPANGHLELLFEYGLGTGDGGPWRARLGEAVDSPEELLRRQLEWAVDHGMIARVRLLAEHGVDVVTPLADGLTPAQHAARNADPATVDYLAARGAPPPAHDPVTAFLAAALAGDPTAAGVAPDVIAQARAQRPGLVVWAAAAGHGSAIPLLVELGFDVNARGRGDAPIEQPWETALHHAAADGDLALARALLALGADPGIRDVRFAATPLGWARHFEQQQLVELLEPVTSEPQ